MNVQSSDDLPPGLSVFASLGILPVGVLVRVYKEGKRSIVRRGFVTDSAALLSASTDISKRNMRGKGWHAWEYVLAAWLLLFITDAMIDSFYSRGTLSMLKNSLWSVCEQEC